jgi:hypothetical protein
MLLKDRPQGRGRKYPCDASALMESLRSITNSMVKGLDSLDYNVGSLENNDFVTRLMMTAWPSRSIGAISSNPIFSAVKTRPHARHNSRKVGRFMCNRRQVQRDVESIDIRSGYSISI